MVTPDEILEEVREWMGTPFQHQCRQKGVASDCIGLLYVVAENLGLAPDEIPVDYIGYKNVPEDGKLERNLGYYMQKVRMSQIQPGDVLLMSFTGDPQHVAFYTGDTIIHALSTAKKTTEHSLSAKWRKRICGAYRFRQ